MKIYSFEKLTIWQKARYTKIAYGSALELLNQTIISNDLEFINQDEYQNIRNEIKEITSMLDALYKSQLKLNS